MYWVLISIPAPNLMCNVSWEITQYCENVTHTVALDLSALLFRYIAHINIAHERNALRRQFNEMPGISSRISPVYLSRAISVPWYFDILFRILQTSKITFWHSSDEYDESTEHPKLDKLSLHEDFRYGKFYPCSCLCVHRFVEKFHVFRNFSRDSVRFILFQWNFARSFGKYWSFCACPTFDRCVIFFLVVLNQMDQVWRQDQRIRPLLRVLQSRSAVIPLVILCQILYG